MKLYGFFYCPCIYESAPGLMSLHKSKDGAEKAMKAHKAKEKIMWARIYDDEEERKEFPFGSHERWDVQEVEVLD